jgi:hypothetical protein
MILSSSGRVHYENCSKLHTFHKKFMLLSLIMTANEGESCVRPYRASAEARMAHYDGRRSEIADEIDRLDKQQREFVHNASVRGRRRGDSQHAERAWRIAQLLTELVALEETYSVRAD